MIHDYEKNFSSLILREEVVEHFISCIQIRIKIENSMGAGVPDNKLKNITIYLESEEKYCLAASIMGINAASELY